MEIKTGSIGITSITNITDEIEDNIADFREEIKNRFEVIDDNTIQYFQNTNNHLENIEKQLGYIEHNNYNEFAEIKHNITQSIKSICEHNIELTKNIANHNADVMKIFHKDILEFICQCTTPLYELVYTEMGDLHKKLRKMLMILVLLLTSSICLGIVIFLLIILG